MTAQFYSRTQAVLGSENIKKLCSSHVLIAGLGGVGGYALEALARMGVGRFTLIDSDVFELSNINRQILCLSSNIGMSKSKAAKERVLAINPEASVSTMQLFIEESNIESIIALKPDVVIDAIDSVASKCLLLSSCLKSGINVVSSMGAALRKDPCRIMTADISKTYGCPLAKAVRTGLKEYGITEGIQCVFSPEKSTPVQKGVLGSLPTVTGPFGFTLASLAVSVLTNN